eukprot:CAMPEP_0119152894 /NCGR_PEP_ID=MMETSP1310-20130426/48445_1 /TAXON_ID=464262 /ORGANISM="Genus nov. species nov., Strain RCC2339" /LENGTH=35 /DNA_ID= /DNA_START= /DNA_END= /DNA_ORIENTATION=
MTVREAPFRSTPRMWEKRTHSVLAAAHGASPPPPI